MLLSGRRKRNPQEGQRDLNSDAGKKESARISKTDRYKGTQKKEAERKRKRT